MYVRLCVFAQKTRTITKNKNRQTRTINKGKHKQQTTTPNAYMLLLAFHVLVFVVLVCLFLGFDLCLPICFVRWCDCCFEFVFLGGKGGMCCILLFVSCCLFFVVLFVLCYVVLLLFV